MEKCAAATRWDDGMLLLLLFFILFSYVLYIDYFHVTIKEEVH